MRRSFFKTLICVVLILSLTLCLWITPSYAVAAETALVATALDALVPAFAGSSLGSFSAASSMLAAQSAMLASSSTPLLLTSGVTATEVAAANSVLASAGTAIAGGMTIALSPVVITALAVVIGIGVGVGINRLLEAVPDPVSTPRTNVQWTSSDPEPSVTTSNTDPFFLNFAKDTFRHNSTYVNFVNSYKNQYPFGGFVSPQNIIDGCAFSNYATDSWGVVYVLCCDSYGNTEAFFAGGVGPSPTDLTGSYFTYDPLADEVHLHFCNSSGVPVAISNGVTTTEAIFHNIHPLSLSFTQDLQLLQDAQDGVMEYITSIPEMPVIVPDSAVIGDIEDYPDAMIISAPDEDIDALKPTIPFVVPNYESVTVLPDYDPDYVPMPDIDPSLGFPTLNPDAAIDPEDISLDALPQLAGTIPKFWSLINHFIPYEVALPLSYFILFGVGLFVIKLFVL